MFTEKRSQPRVKKSIPIQVLFAAQDAKTKSSGQPSVTEDISPQGMCFTCNQQVKPGTHIQIKIELASKARGRFHGFVRHNGVIRWCQRDAATGAFRVGVEFTDTPSDEMKKWNEEMKFHSPSIY